jgi:hypothetical protein
MAHARPAGRAGRVGGRERARCVSGPVSAAIGERRVRPAAGVVGGRATGREGWAERLASEPQLRRDSEGDVVRSLARAGVGERAFVHDWSFY